MTLSVWCNCVFKCIRLWVIKNKLRKCCHLKWPLNVKNVIVYIFFFVYVFTNDIDLYWTLVYIEGNNRVYCMTYINYAAMFGKTQLVLYNYSAIRSQEPLSTPCSLTIRQFNPASPEGYSIVADNIHIRIARSFR